MTQIEAFKEIAGYLAEKGIGFTFSDTVVSDFVVCLNRKKRPVTVVISSEKIYISNVGSYDLKRCKKALSEIKKIVEG